MKTDRMTGVDRLVWRPEDLSVGCAPAVPVPSRHEPTVGRIETLLSEYAMPYDGVVWRAITSVGRLAPGMVVADPLYLSASLDPDQIDGLGIPVAIAVKEGTPVVPLSWLTADARPSDVREVLFARGTRMRIACVTSEQVAADLL